MIKKSPSVAELASADRLASLPTLTPLLLSWYQKNARTLPWRSSPTPYHVWVSEIMLQQTRVDAVIPYYNRFLKELPTIADLAAVTDEQLLKRWEGLGYYSRAKNLKKAAGILMKSYQGELPSSYGELLELPGIGPYTAGAIGSIAFGIALPAVDGNVYRVLSRVLGCDQDIGSPAVKNAFFRAASSMVPKTEPGAFNQSLMDLGALICLPNGAPKCLLCPLQEYCTGFLEGNAQSLPYKSPKRPRKIEEKTIVVVQFSHSLLLHRRNEKGVLSNMWELPALEGHLTEKELKQKLMEQGMTPRSITSLPFSKHLFTHIEWHMSGYQIQLAQKVLPPNCQWVSEEELSEKYALPSAFKGFRSYLF